MVAPVQKYNAFYCIQYLVVFDAWFNCLALSLRRALRLIDCVFYCIKDLWSLSRHNKQCHFPSFRCNVKCSPQWLIHHTTCCQRSHFTNSPRQTAKCSHQRSTGNGSFLAQTFLLSVFMSSLLANATCWWLHNSKAARVPFPVSLLTLCCSTESWGICRA